MSVPEQQVTVGFVGLGNMGWPMARNLHAAGFRLVVRDIEAAKQDQFAAEHPGAVAAASPDAFAPAGLVVTMLPNGAIVRDAMLGWGIGAALRDGALLVEMSSSDPSDTLLLAAGLQPFGVRMVDAPVSRGTPPDTGPSTIRTPNGCRPAASSSVSDGSDELISTSSAPSRRAAPIPQPSIASRTIAPLGSIVTTRPAGVNASGEAAATAPGCSAANRSCFAASMSRTTSRKPAACRFLAIGQPMLPRPTKPTVTCCSGTLIAIAAAFPLLSSASIVIAGRPADQIQPRNDSIWRTNAAWSWPARVP